MSCWATVVLVAVGRLWCAPSGTAAQPGKTTPTPDDLQNHPDSIRGELVSVNQDIWSFAELGLQEHRSAARLTGVLQKAGFKVKEGLSGMPPAFVAEYGSGKPVIAILAQYDALPHRSQQATVAPPPLD